MKFSSISRLLAHSQKNDCSKITCKLCDEVFTSNNRLHEHVRLHHSQKSSVTSASKAMIVRSESHMLDTSSATSKLTPTIRTPSHQSITMMKVFIDCSSSSSSTSSRSQASSLQKPHTTPKAYMTMDNLFAMFTGKRSKKRWNTIHKPMRSPQSSMPGQAQITSYFKPASQPPNSFNSAVFTSCPCPAPRTCFPANRAIGTRQYQNIATGETSNQQRLKAPKMQSPCTSQQEYMAAAGVDHTSKGIRVGTPLPSAGGNNSVKSLVKPSKSSKPFNSAVFSSSLSSALRPYLLTNSKPITPHVLALIWPLTKQ